VDFAYPKWRIAIQGVGYQHHSRRRGFERDNHQAGWLASLDWLCLPFTWNEVQTRPDWIAKLIRDALIARGGPGATRR
ncbi:MAG TPA: DUF559 domain-containing protein, partial [Myxococcaceae bacterium]|nr:DUF559 domain-containing protein [Myxococcaceae bacterium]